MTIGEQEFTQIQKELMINSNIVMRETIGTIFTICNKYRKQIKKLEFQVYDRDSLIETLKDELEFKDRQLEKFIEKYKKEKRINEMLVHGIIFPFND